MSEGYVCLSEGHLASARPICPVTSRPLGARLTARMANKHGRADRLAGKHFEILSTISAMHNTYLLFITLLPIKHEHTQTKSKAFNCFFCCCFHQQMRASLSMCWNQYSIYLF